ncbi:hypothetical protein [Arthrobacter oryzae]|uniref:hypothetical protein n=1 Tax=Arthrobacter oryzae TaxID=409290 RepID=UPI002859FAEE|nr:hypothetical protein [Arthrobacter oryzae]MDR6507730.1 hypothetical protein [Arthrobacter oryzae]
MVRGASGFLINIIMAFGHFRKLVYLRLVAGAVTLVGAASGHLFTLPIFVLFVTLLVLSVRSPYGLDGSHQMYLVIFGALTFASFDPQSIVAVIALGFIAAQSLLAYAVSGFYKLVSKTWRSGDALIGIMSTQSYGSDRIYRLLQRHPMIARLSCWGVIALECSFPLLALAGPPYVYLVLSGALIFHIGTAAVMRLNGFLFAFAAALPAVLFSSSLLNHIAAALFVATA